MRFLLDESAEFRLRGFLRDQGHDVTAIAHDYPASLSDDHVLAIAHAERRILVTNDRDFGELIFRQRLSHAGVIFFRLADQAITTKFAWFDRLLRDYPNQLDQFLVISERGVRIRPSRP
jgi:predicted nuclease of predicted toxin-antitoxin system